MEEEDLRPTFNEFGEIFDLAVIRDKVSGLHRGEEGERKRRETERNKLGWSVYHRW